MKRIVLAVALSFAFAVAAFTAAIAAPSDYDGTWEAKVSCGPSIFREPAFSHKREIVIDAGRFNFAYSTRAVNSNKSQPITYSEDWLGQIEGNSLKVTATGSSPDDISIRPWNYSFDGTATSNQMFDLPGGNYNPSGQMRGCTLLLIMMKPAPASLAARGLPQSPATATQPSAPPSAATQLSAPVPTPLSGPTSTPPSAIFLAQQTAQSPFIGSWCSYGAGGSLTKLTISKIEGTVAAGQYLYNGPPVQMNEPITGSLVDNIFKATMGNISVALPLKNGVLDGTFTNNRVGHTAYVKMNPC